MPMVADEKRRVDMATSTGMRARGPAMGRVEWVPRRVRMDKYRSRQGERKTLPPQEGPESFDRPWPPGSSATHQTV